MLFSSLLFVYIFLPITVALYYIFSEKYRNYLLLFASLIFYGYGEPSFIFVMLLSIIVNYTIALLIDKSFRSDSTRLPRALLLSDIIFNIGLLFIFKYLAFAESVFSSIFSVKIAHFNITLPIGISFFTFQALSYVVDVYKKEVSAQKNPFLVALYISFFPQLIAGPIVRYQSIEEQIKHRIHNINKFSEGCRRFFLGFSKKVILANNLAVFAERVFALDPATSLPSTLWIGSLCYSLQIFYDFSGYSDMAIGLGKMFGFEFVENFNYPYMASSVTDFWRRWHISLSSWFRDYVYIPLGGSRVPFLKHVRNLFVVWLLTGIWHGANYTFIVWGIFYFVFLFLEKFFIKPAKHSAVFKILWRIVTLLCINFAWIIFNSRTITAACHYILGMVGFYSTQAIASNVTPYFIREYGTFLCIAIISATPVFKIISEYANKRPVLSNIKMVLEPLIYGLLFLWSISYLVLGAHNPFIYFNF